MARLTLPEGKSIRQIAEQLGVATDALLQHAGVNDAEAPLPVSKAIDVPDGFLKSRAKKEQLSDAMSAPSGKRGGMNMWLALDIEQKRTRVAGGMHAQGAKEDELQGLDEARRTYLRFDRGSNALAIALYGNLTSTPSIEVRGRAFAGQALAYAHDVHLFRASASRGKPQVLSVAKAAQLAQPKLADAHVAMALALLIDASPLEEQEAREELSLAQRYDRRAPWPYAVLASVALRQDDREATRQHLAEGLERDASCVLLLDTKARLHEREQNLLEAHAVWQRACEVAPSYLWAQVGLARTLHLQGAAAEAQKVLEAALASEEDAELRDHLRAGFVASPNSVL